MTRTGRPAPRFGELVVSAIRLLQSVEGSTATEIAKHVRSRYDLTGDRAKRQVRLALKRGLESGLIRKSKRGYVTSMDNAGVGEEPLGGPDDLGEPSDCMKCRKSKSAVHHGLKVKARNKKASLKSRGRTKSRSRVRRSKVKSKASKKTRRRASNNPDESEEGVRQAGNDDPGSRRQTRSKFLTWYQRVVGNKREYKNGRQARRPRRPRKAAPPGKAAGRRRRGAAPTRTTTRGRPGRRAPPATSFRSSVTTRSQARRARGSSAGAGAAGRFRRSLRNVIPRLF